MPSRPTHMFVFQSIHRIIPFRPTYTAVYGAAQTCRVGNLFCYRSQSFSPHILEKGVNCFRVGIVFRSSLRSHRPSHEPQRSVPSTVLHGARISHRFSHGGFPQTILFQHQALILPHLFRLGSRRKFMGPWAARCS